MIPSDPLSLADWRRTVAEMYATIRYTAVPQTAWRIFRQTRDDLFRSHPHLPWTLNSAPALANCHTFPMIRRFG